MSSAIGFEAILSPAVAPSRFANSKLPFCPSLYAFGVEHGLLRVVFEDVVVLDVAAIIAIR